ncbi:MAG: aspartate/glutamate racemase family protein [Parvibaculaceae bacterium]|nr:aspartate/glutamate racemase family protein [Parvibaculaceae bacterium]
MTKLLGLIGGMSWESTQLYCRYLNALAQQKLGGRHAAKFIVYSVDFGEIGALQQAGDWAGAARILCDAAQRLERAGADELLLCTNTMHIVASDIQASVSIPLLHIADATAQHIVRHGLKKVGLLATRYTMEGHFYKDRMQEQHGLTVLTPSPQDRAQINTIIYDELCAGKVLPRSHRVFQEICGRLIDQGAEGIIMGCTEVGLLLKEGDVQVPLFDSARLHVDEAVRPCP